MQFLWLQLIGCCGFPYFLLFDFFEELCLEKVFFFVCNSLFGTDLCVLFFLWTREQFV